MFSKGNRGFKSPPLRHTVWTIYLHLTVSRNSRSNREPGTHSIGAEQFDGFDRDRFFGLGRFKARTITHDLFARSLLFPSSPAADRCRPHIWITVPRNFDSRVNASEDMTVPD